MMNADQKRASFSTTPVFAELRQATNEHEEACRTVAKPLFLVSKTQEERQ